MLHVPDDVDATAVGSRLVLYHRMKHTATVLNPSGAALWRRIAETSAQVDELVDAIADQHLGVDFTQIRADIDIFVADLVSKNLLEIDESSR